MGTPGQRREGIPQPDLGIYRNAEDTESPVFEPGLVWCGVGFVCPEGQGLSLTTVHTAGRADGRTGIVFRRVAGGCMDCVRPQKVVNGVERTSATSGRR